MAKRLIDATLARDTATIDLIVHHIDRQPTVDAVEVCYCKDCKYWEKQKDSAQGCCLLSGNYPTGGWYCADGKRRCEND